VRLDPNNRTAHYRLGLLLLESGRGEEAFPHFVAACPQQPAEFYAHLGLGKMFLNSLRTAEARRQMERAVQLVPNDPSGHFFLGVAQAAEGRTAEAIRCFQEALRLQADHDAAYSQLGMMHLRLGDKEEALQCCRRAVALNAGSAANHANLALVLSEWGQRREARAHYQAALRADPQWIGAASTRAWRLATRAQVPAGALAEAVALARQAAEAADMSDPLLLQTLAAAYAAMGRYPQAVETGQQALRIARAVGGGPAELAALPQQLREYQAGRPWVAAGSVPRAHPTGAPFRESEP
jgi:spermidine synthase